MILIGMVLFAVGGPLDEAGLVFDPCHGYPDDVCYSNNFSSPVLPSDFVNVQPGAQIGNWHIRQSVANSSNNAGSQVSELVESSQQNNGSICWSSTAPMLQVIQKIPDSLVMIRVHAKLESPGGFGIAWGINLTDPIPGDNFYRVELFTGGCANTSAGDVGYITDWASMTVRSRSNFIQSYGGSLFRSNLQLPASAGDFFEVGKWYEFTVYTYASSDARMLILKWDPTISSTIDQALISTLTFPANMAVEPSMGGQTNIALYCAKGTCVFDDLVIVQQQFELDLQGPLACYWCNGDGFTWAPGSETWCRCCSEGGVGCGTPTYGYTLAACNASIAGGICSSTASQSCQSTTDLSHGYAPFCPAPGVLRTQYAYATTAGPTPVPTPAPVTRIPTPVPPTPAPVTYAPTPTPTPVPTPVPTTLAPTPVRC
jgi:hypothetical protein